MFSTVVLCSDLFPFLSIQHCWVQAPVKVSRFSCLSLCSKQNMATLSNSVLSCIVGVILLPIYSELLPAQNDSIRVASSEGFKVNVGWGQSGHSETVWHNKWKCPISASRHEFYSCHWCHQIKSAHKSQSYQSLPCFLAYNSGITEPSTGSSCTCSTVLRHLATVKMSPESVKMFFRMLLMNFAFVIAAIGRKNDEKRLTPFYLWKFIKLVIKMIK